MKSYWDVTSEILVVLLVSLSTVCVDYLTLTSPKLGRLRITGISRICPTILGLHLINRIGNGVDSNIEDAYERLQLNFITKSVLNDDRLFNIILQSLGLHQ